MGRLVISLLAFIAVFLQYPLLQGVPVGTIREYKKEDGSVSYHAEIRLKGYPPQENLFEQEL